jgi:hypothetical protein
MKGSRLASSSMDNTVCLWDEKTGAHRGVTALPLRDILALSHQQHSRPMAQDLPQRLVTKQCSCGTGKQVITLLPLKAILTASLSWYSYQMAQGSPQVLG